jgi:hypothetical protein
MPRYQPQYGSSIEAVYRELQRVSAALDELYDGVHEVRNAAPERLKLGMLAHADGTNWNPGAGPGVYSYEGTSTASAAWVKL